MILDRELWIDNRDLRIAMCFAGGNHLMQSYKMRSDEDPPTIPVPPGEDPPPPVQEPPDKPVIGPDGPVDEPEPRQPRRL